MTTHPLGRALGACLRRLRAWGWILFFCAGAGAVTAHETLTNASAVLALSVREATSNIPVLVAGVVTAAEPGWGGRFFVQDASGGVFVDNRANSQPAPGDVVKVSGFSHPGGYAPVITKPHWEKVGVAPLPAARPVTSERLMSGAEDGQRVEVTGIVRTTQPGGDRVGLEIASGGNRFSAYFPPRPGLDLPALVGAKVRLRGTAAAAFTPLRHFLTVTLFMPRSEDMVVEEAAPAIPFDEPTVPLNSIAQYRNNPPPGYQVHVRGLVTYQRKGECLFLLDDTGGLQVKTHMTNAVVPGDMVEAVGFPAVENYLPVLEDAVFRKTSASPVPVEPNRATIGGLQRGYHQADYIFMRGRLLDRLVRGAGPGVNGADIQTTLVLQASNMVFAAEKETTEPNTLLASIPIGSLVEVRGICLLDSTADGKIKSFRLLMPTSHDVQVIEEPSWFTPRRLLTGLVTALLVLVVAVAWTLWVVKKNSVLRALVNEKETAQRELQQAHDQLEERVRERTAQLKVEMTARKETELQFRAVLTERTRLAQELHDTLEQTLTGIALQQDLVASQFGKNADRASHHLKLARSLMRQSQDDLHRSVWGLRSRADEKFTLASALLTSVRQIAGDTGLRVETEASGEAVPLSEVVEENLLRIAQEAVTNVVKHAAATVVGLRLQFTPEQVVIEIHDDGKGFTPEACSGPKDGHFGLLGIRERVDRLGGQVRITSVPGAGTLVRVEIPVSVPNVPPPPASAAIPHEERV